MWIILHWRTWSGVAYREIGSGYIGGKSVGMLLARRMLVKDPEDAARFHAPSGANDSYYLGADIFYTYIVQNGCWGLRTRQKTMKGILPMRRN